MSDNIEPANEEVAGQKIGTKKKIIFSVVSVLIIFC